MSESAFGVDHGEFSKKAPPLAGLLRPYKGALPKGASTGGKHKKTLDHALSAYKGAVPKGPSNEALANRPKTMALRSARRNAQVTSAKPGRAMGS